MKVLTIKKLIKKTALIMGALMMTNTLSAIAADSAGFTDVPTDHKYAEGISYCVNNGIIRRTAPTEFSPEEKINRELFACVLYRLENSPVTESEITFDDVEKGRWFQVGVTWAAEKNILGGYGDGIFGVNDGITREQLATALWRYAGYPAADGEAAFNDAAAISPWAVEPVAWAVKSNILSIVGGSFEPQSIVTRGMAADAIMNFVKLYETPYVKSLSENVQEALPQGEFIERISLKINGTDDEAIVALTDSKPTREFIAQLPMTVTFIDFGAREKFGRMPIPLSEDEALLSGYEIGDFSYGTAYDCMITFYDQDNEVIDGVIKLGSFESGLELFSGRENIEVTISALEK